MVFRFSIVSLFVVLASLVTTAPVKAFPDARSATQRLDLEMAASPSSTAQGSTEVFALMVFGATMLLGAESTRTDGYR